MSQELIEELDQQEVPTPGEASSTQEDDFEQEEGSCAPFNLDGEEWIDKDKRLLSMEAIIREIDIQDEEGNDMILEVYQASSYIPENYVKIGKIGFMSDLEGNLVDFDGQILLTNKELATMLTKISKGEDIGNDF